VADGLLIDSEYKAGSECYSRLGLCAEISGPGCISDSSKTGLSASQHDEERLIMDAPVGSGVYKEADSLDGEGAIRSLEDAGWWLQVIPISTDKRDLCPYSCVLYACRNRSNCYESGDRGT
jgi:hypothetical protein